MATLYVRRKGNQLVPHSAAAALALDALPQGVPMRCEVTRPRSGPQHRLFWALATYVAEALNDGPAASEWTPEAVVEMLKIATGHVDLVALPPREAKRLGVTHVAKPKSIAFAAMDGVAFSRFMNAAMTYVRDTLCPWIEASPHWGHIEAILRESEMMGALAPKEEA